MQVGSRPTIPVVVLVAVLLAGAALVGWRAFRSQPTPTPAPSDADTLHDPIPPDPRRTFDTPFRNVQPHVAYVGDATCSGCHSTIDKTFHAHPMGRSAEWTRGAAPIERLGAAAGNPFRIGPFELHVERVDGRTTHIVQAGTLRLAVPADLAIGSGTRGRSYLANHNGAIWQSPVSWYASNGGRWDLSPGFDLAARMRRPVVPDCLVCHVHRVDPVAMSLNRYREPLLPVQVSIGCEQCHGPGALHVAERSADEPLRLPDTSIVNPKHLSPDLRSAVCAQCHLQGVARVPRVGRELHDFRPGLPFESFVSVYVPHPDLSDGRRSVGQFEQMERSRCFQASNGKLGCTSCHDPHEAPTADRKDPFYRGRCMSCHETNRCTAPPADRHAKADSCIVCHMPKADSSNIVHASITDHGVPRRPATPVAPRGIPPWVEPVVPFRTGAFAASGPEADRAIGIALADVLAAAHPAAQSALAATAAGRLERSVSRWTDDFRGRLELSAALGRCGRTSDQFQVADRLVRSFPTSELALAELAAAATATDHLDVAERTASDWVKVAPGSVEPLLVRAAILLLRKDLSGVDRDASAALALEPLHPRALLLRAVVRHRRGEVREAQADAEFAAGLLGNPQATAAAREWYRRALSR